MIKIIIILILFPAIVFSQDSTATYSLPRYKVDRLIKIALKAKECDTLVKLQNHAIDDYSKTQTKADSVIASQSKLIKTFKKEQLQQDSLQRDNIKLIAIEANKKKKWQLATIGLGVLIILKVVLSGQF